MNEQFKPEELREQWNRICETHDEDRWADIAARIDEEAAGVVTPVPKKRSRGRTVATVASICAAAVVAVTVGFPLLGNGVAMLLGGNSAAPDEDLHAGERPGVQNGLLDGTQDREEGAPEAGDAVEDGSSAEGELRDDVAQDGDDYAGEVESGAVVDDSTTSTEPTYTEPTYPTQVPVRPYPSGEGTGGSSTVAYYKADRMDSLQGYLYEWVLEQRGRNAIEEFFGRVNWRQYCYTDIYPDIYDLVRHFEIPREVFESINQEEYDRYSDPDNEWDIYHDCYTPEEIEDIYTLSRLEFNRKYAAEDAVVTAEGHIYSSTWFVTHPVSDWQELGFTIEEVWQSLIWARHYADAPDTNSPSDYYFGRYMNRSSYGTQGFAVFEEKLILFAAEKAGVTIPNSGDGRYNTYISHARWRGIGDAYSQYILQHHSQEAIDAFKAQLAAEQSGDDYAFKGDAINRWVAHFEIPRAAFEQINTQQKTYYKTTYGEDSFEYWDNVYTDEEIDDIYTLSLAEFNMKYANPCTLVVGEELYPFGWFLENRMSKWWEELEIREKYLEALLVEFKKVYPDESEDIDNYAEKLEDYINNHGK